MMTCSKLEADEDVTCMNYTSHLLSDIFIKDNVVHYASEMYDDLDHYMLDDLCISSYLLSATDDDTYPKKSNGHTQANGLRWRDSHIAECILTHYKKPCFDKKVKAVFIYRDQEEKKELNKVFNILSDIYTFPCRHITVMFKPCKECKAIKQYGHVAQTSFYDKIHWIPSE